MTVKRKNNIGRVVSDKMNKTIVVAVQRYRTHRLYKRRTKSISRFKAHDEAQSCKIGDTVRIEETRPLSKTKRWRVVEIVIRAEQVEVKPEEVDRETVEELNQ